MTSPEPTREQGRDQRLDPADVGLLSPVSAGTEAAALTGDAAFLRAMLEAEAALTRAQAALGVVSVDAAAAVTTAAARLADFDVRSLALRARSGGNPVIPLVADLVAGVPEQHADAVHHGATSQDILDTATMLVAARVRTSLLADLDQIADRLAVLADEHRATPMPGRTLTQHAVPTSFGLKAAGWRSLMLDARDRLAGLPLPAQLGGAAGTLAALGPHGPAVADRFADELGLDRPLLPWHVLRTPVAELGASLALVGGALGKLAADVLVLSRTEIGELAEGTGGGSSAMPHKANPVRATLIASAARQLPGLAAVLFCAMTAEDERPTGAWHAEWQPLREALRLAAGAAADAVELVDGLRVDTARMRAHLDLTRGLVVSERLVDALAPALGRRNARAVLASASRDAVADDVDLATALARQPELAARPSSGGGTGTGIDAAQLASLLDPAAYLGAAPDLTDRALRRRPAPDQPRTERPYQDMKP